MQSNVYLIDFSNFAYKFKSVYTFARRQVNGVEVDTSVIVGFIRALKANIFENIVIVLDGVPMRSLALLPNYKGQRMHDDLSSRISVPRLELIQFLTKVGGLINKNIDVVCSPCQETDEVIASLVYNYTGNLPARANFISKLNTRSLEEDKFLKYLSSAELSLYKPEAAQVVIGSTDGDFIQLQRFPGVYIDDTTSGRNVHQDRKSKSTSELSPSATILYKALYGDQGDNIPALDLPWKKDAILKEINKLNYSEVEEIYNCITSGSQTTKLKALCEYIVDNCKEQFYINWNVAFLPFRSYPFKVTFPDYDITKTIAKYGLRV